MCAKILVYFFRLIKLLNWNVCLDYKTVTLRAESASIFLEKKNDFSRKIEGDSACRVQDCALLSRYFSNCYLYSIVIILTPRRNYCECKTILKRQRRAIALTTSKLLVVSASRGKNTSEKPFSLVSQSIE